MTKYIDPRRPPAAAKLDAVLDRNIAALLSHRREREAAASLGDRAATAIGEFAGSLTFVFLHLVFFGSWIALNLGWLPIVPPWDATLVFLATLASVEAIFLSTFVLINQNRMAAADAERAELDLQINLLSEHETARLIALVDAIAVQLDVKVENVDELKADIDPKAVLDRIEEQREE
jgi:uncharacterized membrane protein